MVMTVLLKLYMQLICNTDVFVQIRASYKFF